MRKSTCFVFAVALIFTCSNAFSQTVMKAIDGSVKLNGGSTVPLHANEIDILSNSLGLDRCSTCSANNVSDYNIIIQLSPAIIAFKKLLLTGKKLTSIDVTYIKPGPTPFVYYKVRMENVFVESVQESGSSPEAPVFSVSLHTDRIAWQQVAQNADGSIGVKTTYGWDVVNNVAWSFTFP